MFIQPGDKRATYRRMSGQQLYKPVKETGQQKFAKAKLRQVDKFYSLLAKCNSTDQDSLRAQQSKKWIVNVSKKVLDKSEVSILSKGLNFAVAPEQVPLEDFVVATEKVCGQLGQTETDVLRSKVVSRLCYVKSAPPNLPTAERSALSRLKKDVNKYYRPTRDVQW